MKTLNIALIGFIALGLAACSKQDRAAEAAADAREVANEAQQTADELKAEGAATAEVAQNAADTAHNAADHALDQAQQAAAATTADAADAAKDAADVVLLQKDLGVLEEGILEGRRTFTNMLKYIKITASSNFGNILSIVCASAFLLARPIGRTFCPVTARATDASSPSRWMQNWPKFTFWTMRRNPVPISTSSGQKP